MIILDCEQGSEEWRQARLGIPTASRFSSIITPKTMKLSSQAKGYLHELIAEWILGVPLDEPGSGFMERGKEMEGQAVAAYELARDLDTKPVGFCLSDDKRCGCSPDRLVGETGGLEIKIPSAKVHVGYLLDGPPEQYRCQIQGGLWITDLEWWDFFSWHPDMPPVIVRQERDEKFIAALASAVGMFCEQIEEAREKVRRQGFAPDQLAEKAAAEEVKRLEALETALFGPEPENPEPVQVTDQKMPTGNDIPFGD